MQPTEKDRLVEKSVNTIRTLAIDAVQKANSGHPGAPMGLAAAGYTIFKRHLRHNPKNPKWFNRDRFVLSNGHASMLLYALLHLTGYEEMTLEQLESFRQWGSITPGHPEAGMTPGVETTTGPLGQGLATAVGLALAEAHLHDKYGEIVDHYTYGICSDGDLMEGVTAEASSLAGHLKLGKLIFLYDDNHITIDGTTEITFTEDLLKRYDSYGWHTLRVEDGNDVDAIDKAIQAAKKVTDKPSLISIRTIIGYGSPHKENKSSSHGAPLGVEEVLETKAAYGWDHPPFFVPEDVKKDMDATEIGGKLEAEWRTKFEQFKIEKHRESQELMARMGEKTVPDLDAILPKFPADEKGLATRQSGGKVLSALMRQASELIGGSADLAGSNNTLNPDLGIISAKDKSGQNIHFGVREHAMGAICNGLCLHGGCRGFNATFLVFSDYMKPALRIAALTKLPMISIFTHDSIGLGEDGPTHQPIEQLAALRSIPNYAVYRPADANEVVECWRAAYLRREGPSALVLTRQSLPTLDREKYSQIGDASRGGYVVFEPKEEPVGVLLATGSEVHLCVEAAEKLEESGKPVRVLSMPCWSEFDSQPDDYREEILPSQLTKRLAVEAASSFGWHKYIGLKGKIICMESFGESAPAEKLFEEFGFTVKHIVSKMTKLLD